MRAFAAASFVLLLPAIAGAVVITPTGGLVIQDTSDTYIVFFQQVQLSALEEWQLSIPATRDLTRSDYFFLSGLLPTSGQAASVWLTYTNAQDQMATTTSQAIIYGQFNCDVTLPLVPADLVLHVKNSNNDMLAIDSGLLVTVYVATPDPTTIGLLGVGAAGLFARRRRQQTNSSGRA